MKISRIAIGLFIIIAFWLNCSKKDQPKLLSVEEFVSVYTEYLFILTQDTSKVEVRQQYLENILSGRGKSLEYFSNTWNYLNENPEKWEKIMDRTVQVMQDKMKGKE